MMMLNNLSKGGARSLFWLIAIGGLLIIGWRFIFGKNGKESPLDKLGESADKAVGAFSNATDSISETVNDWSGNHHKNEDYQNKLKAMRRKILPLTVGTRYLSTEKAKDRAKQIHKTFNASNEDENLIYSMFLQNPDSKIQQMIIDLENVDFIRDNSFVQRYLISKQDFYAIVYHWGLDNNDQTLIEKLKERVSEWGIIYDNLPEYFRGGSKNVFTYLKKKYGDTKCLQSERYKKDYYKFKVLSNVNGFFPPSLLDLN